MDDSQTVYDSLARYFSVLGEPTRLRILHVLCREERCVSDILRETGLAQANVSRHLGLMYQAALVSRRREGNQVFYRVSSPVYLDLCRTVLSQVSPTAGSDFGDPSVPTASDPFIGHHKEETSV